MTTNSASAAGTARRHGVALGGFLALAAAALHAAPVAPRGGPSTRAPFELIGPDYKKPVSVPDSFFNPFKVEATTALSQQGQGPAITEESVRAAVLQRGVSGIFFGPKPGQDRVIIGDQVFSVGDELTFPDGRSSAPLLSGTSVTLRSVDEKSLRVEFTSESEGTRAAVVSLKNFWRP